MRIPVAVTLESRDGSVSKDAKTVNAVVELRGDQPIARPRAGMSDQGLIHTGTAQLLYSWNGVNAIIGDSLYRGTIGTVVSGPTTTAISPTNAGLRFDAQEVSSGAATQVMMVKNKTQAWTIDRTGAKSAITFASTMGAATYPVLSLVRVSGTATATFGSETGFNVGDTMTIAGATPIAYNGAQTVTAITPYSFTPAQNIPVYITRGPGSTTATGNTITAHGLTDGGTYTISGSDQSQYNGAFTITVTSPSLFNFTVAVTAEAPVTPATGSPAVSNWTDATVTSFDNRGPSGQTVVRCTTGFGNSFVNTESVTIPSWNGLSWPAGTYTVSNRTSSGFELTVAGASGIDGASTSLSVYRTAPSISSITRSGTTATVTFSSAHKFFAGETTLSITGATQSGYNITGIAVTVASTTTATFPVTVTPEAPVSPGSGTMVVTKPSVTVNGTVSFAIGGTPTTPATGTITAQGVGGTVPGIAYIDGYFFVMDTNGVVWQSAIDDPTTWSALAFNTVQSENGAGKALGRALNYLVAYKEWSTEFFYDAKTANFAFAPVANGFLEIGCASGDSLATLEGAAFWLSQTRQRGRSVHMMQGINGAQKISTPDVERILNADSLATVYAYTLKQNGHPLYVLTLVNSNITLVYDVSSQAWTQWTSITAGTAVNVHNGLAFIGTTTAGAAFAIQSISSTSYRVASGDFLEYDVWISASSPAATTFSDGGMTILFSDATTGNALTDADGFAMAQPAVGFDAIARGVWKSRRIALSSKAALNTTAFRLRNDSAGVGTHRTIFRNIRITDGTNTKLSIYATSGAPLVNTTFASSLTSGILCGAVGLTRSGNVATVELLKAHGMTSNDLVLMAGADQADYNGVFPVTATSTTAYTYPVFNAPTTPSTGTILLTPYTSSYFKFTKYCDYQGNNLFLHETDGHLYNSNTAVAQDNGLPIDYFFRTSRLDGGSSAVKIMRRISVIGDNVADTGLVRWSDDDCQTFSNWREVDLSSDQPNTRRCGDFRRRTLEFRHIGNSAPRIEALELEVQ